VSPVKQASPQRYFLYVARPAGLNPLAVGYRSMDLAVTNDLIGGSTPRPAILNCWRRVTASMQNSVLAGSVELTMTSLVMGLAPSLWTRGNVLGVLCRRWGKLI
jgi:hypothetical protein